MIGGLRVCGGGDGAIGLCMMVVWCCSLRNWEIGKVWWVVGGRVNVVTQLSLFLRISRYLSTTLCLFSLSCSNGTLSIKVYIS